MRGVQTVSRRLTVGRGQMTKPASTSHRHVGTSELPTWPSARGEGGGRMENRRRVLPSTGGRAGEDRAGTLRTLRPCRPVGAKGCVLPESQGELRNHLQILARDRILNTLPECLPEGEIYFSVRNVHTDTVGVRGWGPPCCGGFGAVQPAAPWGSFQSRLRPPPFHAHAGQQRFPFLMPALPFHHNEDSKWGGGGDGRRGKEHHGSPSAECGHKGCFL